MNGGFSGCCAGPKSDGGDGEGTLAPTLDAVKHP